MPLTHDPEYQGELVKYAKLLLILCAFFAFKASIASEYTSAELFPPLTPENRLKLATNMYSDFYKLRSAVPTLSPSQNTWLRSETKAAQESKSAARLRNLWATSEYDLNIVNSSLDLIIHALSSIKKSNKIQNNEVLHWAVVSNILSDRSFWQSLHALSGKGLVSTELLEFINNTPSDLELNVANSVSKARHILSSVRP